MSHRSWQRGMALVPVTLILAAVGALVLALTLRAGLQANAVSRETEADQAGYLAEAAYSHARSTADAADCRNYPAVTDTTLSSGSYQATVAPSNGAPVTITASGTVNLARARVVRSVVPRAVPQTVLLQPADGDDTDLDENDGFDSNGSDGRMITRSDDGDDRRRVLLRFDLSSLPAETEVVRAALSLYVDDVSGGPALVDVHRLTRSWRESQASWRKHDSGFFDFWSKGGGEYDPAPAGSFVPAVGRHDVDITELVRGWHGDEEPNHGVLLKVSDEDHRVAHRYYTSDESNVDRHPRLEVTHTCPCDTACAVPPTPVCDADFLPENQVAQFSSAALNEHWGLAYLPAGLEVAGVPVHSAGGWLLVDKSNKELRLSNPWGGMMATLPVPADNPTDVAYVASGAWYRHLAVTSPSDRRVYLLNLDGVLIGSFSTLGVSDNPMGITYIGKTASGIYDGKLAISSDKGAHGGSGATISLVDQSGTLLTAFDVSAFTNEPWGIAHLPGSDTLLVVDQDGGAFLFTFAGTLAGQYDAEDRFGVDRVLGAAIHGQSCAHALTDREARLVRSVAAP